MLPAIMLLACCRALAGGSDEVGSNIAGRDSHPRNS
jgi:hypothetical protein